MFEFPFIEGAATDKKEKFDWWLYHVTINFICWGILVDFGIIIARYFKTYSWYLNAHGALMMLIVVASLFATIVEINATKLTYKYEKFK